MKYLTPTSLLIGLVLSAPGLWQAWSDPSVDMGSAVGRFLLAVMLASVGLAMLNSMVRSYKRGAGRPKRRSQDRRMFDRESGA
ncbi:hypothetical protein GALL_369050 [mine drainage metagenome]|uniref:Uncharacterized protein n=1 Tax=mine drainage metagenome TaxID=410659 RepID=A0A1J5QDR1_9ZZZZ